MKGCWSAILLVISLAVSGLAQNSAMNRNNMNGPMMGSAISGSVLSPEGNPVSDARIELRDLQTGAVLASGYTRSDGSFEFSSLPPTSYEVVAIRGMAQTSERVPAGEMNAAVTLRMSSADPNTEQADGNATVSVAEYKVPEKAREAYHKAEAALAKNKLEDVNKYVRKALEIYPSYAAALTLRGVMALDNRDPNTAMGDLDKAIHSDPGYAMAYAAMGAALNQLRRFDDALRACDRAVTLAPNAWQSHFEMAKSYIGKADYQHALEQLTRAQQDIPHDYAPIHLIRAHVMLAMKSYSDAVSELEAFLRLAPQDSQSPQARETLAKVKAFIASSASSAIAAR